jgi:hypothetical protein
MHFIYWGKNTIGQSRWKLQGMRSAMSNKKLKTNVTKKWYNIVYKINKKTRKKCVKIKIDIYHHWLLLDLEREKLSKHKQIGKFEAYFFFLFCV